MRNKHLSYGVAAVQAYHIAANDVGVGGPDGPRFRPVHHRVRGDPVLRRVAALRHYGVDRSNPSDVKLHPQPRA